MIKFECPACAHLLGARKEQAGKTEKCPNCNQLLHVPQKESTDNDFSTIKNNHPNSCNADFKKSNKGKQSPNFKRSVLLQINTRELKYTMITLGTYTLIFIAVAIMITPLTLLIMILFGEISIGSYILFSIILALVVVAMILMETGKPQKGIIREQYGHINHQMTCPHCQMKGKIRTKAIKQKKGISGGKATAAIFTGGVSLLATGLSRKEEVTQAYCNNCSNKWYF